VLNFKYEFLNVIVTSLETLSYLKNSIGVGSFKL